MEFDQRILGVCYKWVRHSGELLHGRITAASDNIPSIWEM